MAGETPGVHPLVGASLGGRYRVTRHLFEGARGAVFEAHDDDGKSFAVKVIDRSLVSDDALSRFIRAVSLMAGSQSDRIVPILDVGHDIARDLVFIVMPLLSGEDLGALIRRTGPLSPDVVVRIMRQAAEAVASAHALDLVHRNVKPTNLFMETRGDGTVHLRIADFALGQRTVSDGSSRATWLALQYLSPEQASNSKSVDRRTDVWSLGATMYELLAGVAPWGDATSMTELLAAMESGETPPLQDRAPWVDATIAAVVKRAMSRDPEQRFASANASAARLKAIDGDDAALTASMLVPIDPRVKSVVASRIDPEPANAFAPTIDSSEAAPTSVDPLLSHKLGGRYVVKRLLGTGGMGAVYEVEGANGARFAAKVILRDIADQNVALVARFLREGRSSTRIRDEHVTRTIELGTDIVLGVPFIVMELLVGRDLGAIMKERGAIEPLPLLRVFLQAARGLAAAHAEGIIHRDVKPANIFLHAPDESQPVLAKICDFGLAKATAGLLSDHSSQDLTQSGGMLGTPFYMSPEHATSAKTVDARTDVWSLAASLFEGLSGRKLWADYTSLGELIGAIWSQPVPSLGDVAPGIDPAIVAVVDRGLARDPKLRWSTMNEMADALAKLVHGSDAVKLDELTHVSSSRLGKSVRSPRAESVVGGIGTLGNASRSATLGSPGATGSMVSLETGSVQVTPPPTMPERALTPKSRKARAAWQIGIGVVAAAAIGGATLFASRAAKTGAPNALTANGDAAGVSVAAPVASSPDFGSTMSTNPQAVAAYHAGMQSFRDGAGDIARARLDDAIKLDPTFAAAHLRRLTLSTLEDATTRDHAIAASQYRSSLGAHDRSLLDAYIPWSTQPRDAIATETKLADLVAREPSDADFSYHLCRIRSFANKHEDAVAICRTVSRMDPELVDAHHFEAFNLEQLGDVAGALNAYEACFERARLATSCLSSLAQLQMAEGSCSDAVKTARKFVALDPNSRTAYTVLARALYATGESLESVRDVYERARLGLDAEEASIDRLQVEGALALLQGDFSRADRLAEQWEEQVSKRPDEWSHLLPVIWRVSIDVELGRRAEASARIEKFLKRRSAWTPGAPPDLSIYLTSAEFRLGNIGRDKWKALRNDWVNAQLVPSASEVGLRGTLWQFGFAGAAFDRESALEAVDAAPSYLPIPQGIDRTPDFDEAAARAYSLAGRTAEAGAFAKRAVSSCNALSSPLETTQANLSLAQSLDAVGDQRGACAALAVVKRRWGGAGRSISASTASRQMLRLNCRNQD